MLTFKQYINEQRIDELSSDLLKRAAIAAKIETLVKRMLEQDVSRKQQLTH